MKTMTLSYFGRYENENNDLKLRQLKKKLATVLADLQCLQISWSIAIFSVMFFI